MQLQDYGVSSTSQFLRYMNLLFTKGNIASIYGLYSRSRRGWSFLELGCAENIGRGERMLSAFPYLPLIFR